MNSHDRITVSAIEEIPALLSDPDSFICAGGTALIPSLENTEARLVDISELASLSGIKEKGTRLEIGALTTLEAIGASPKVRAWFPALADSADAISDPEIRHKGTLGGNLADRNIPGDLIPALVTANAKITIRTDADHRETSIDKLYKSNGDLRLAEDELITKVSLPVWLDSVSAFSKNGERSATESGEMSAAIQMSVTPDNIIASVRACMIGKGIPVTRLLSVERTLKNQDFTPELVRLAAGQVSKDIPLGSGEKAAALITSILEKCSFRALERTQE